MKINFNTDSILAESVLKVEGILRKLIEDALEAADNEQLNINIMEKLMGVAIAGIIGIILNLGGVLLSAVAAKKIEEFRKGSNQKFRVIKKGATITVKTVFGPLTIVRDILFNRRSHSSYDGVYEVLQIDTEHRMTNGVKELVTFAGQFAPSFKEASALLKKLANLEVSPKTIQVISEEVGKKLFEEDMKQAEEIYAAQDKWEDYFIDEAGKKDDVFYIMADGSTINTRTKGEDGSSWREMKLATMFRGKDILNGGKDRSVIVNKRYVPYLGSVEGFKKLVWAASLEEGYGKVRETVVIGDGAPWLWKMCDELYPDAVQILDYYHFSENVNDYAKYIYPEDEVSRKRWVDQVLNAARDGRVDDCIKLVEAKKVDKLPPNVVNLYHYVTSNKERIDYKRYEECGYYIGSGCVESGHKTVIHQRMKQAGMRWGLDGGQYIATLRGRYKSGLWDEVVAAING